MSPVTVTYLERQEPAAASLLTEHRATVDTATAALYLNRRKQTLQKWHCFGNGPVRPVMVGGRLAWPVADMRKLMLGEVQR